MSDSIMHVKEILLISSEGVTTSLQPDGKSGEFRVLTGEIGINHDKLTIVEPETWTEVIRVYADPATP